METKSSLKKLNPYPFLKSSIAVAFALVFKVAQTKLIRDNFQLDWKFLGAIALSRTLSCLVINLLTNNQDQFSQKYSSFIMQVKCVKGKHRFVLFYLIKELAENPLKSRLNF